MSKRDEFSEPAKRVIAGRVGYRCSDPECINLTIGPTVDSTKLFNVGAACHITAAAEGGPRFDKSMTPEQRKHPDNGIWMCRTHGDQIDDDPIRYPVELLRAWKKDAEARTFAELGKIRSQDGNAPVALLSPAERFGIRAEMQLPDGTFIPWGRPFDPYNDETYKLGIPTLVMRFLIAKINVPLIMLHRLTAIVDKYEQIPEGTRPLMGAYPQSVFAYIIELAPPENGSRECPALIYVRPGEQTPVPFEPLVIDDDIPAVIDTRFAFKQAGMYTFSLDAVIMAGVMPHTIRVLNQHRVILA